MVVRRASLTAQSLYSTYKDLSSYCRLEHLFRGTRSTSTIASKKGTGFQSLLSNFAATVFGATGFLGRYVVQQLARNGAQLFVPYRGSEDCCKHLTDMGASGQVVPVKFDIGDENSIKAAMSASNVVINLIGRDYESHSSSFKELNIKIPERISRLARLHGGVVRYVHVSALGASPENRAPQYKTKAAGEEITLGNFPEATILRPAHLVGTEDRFLNTWAGFAKSMPCVPIIGDGSTKFQPAHVTDVVAAILAVLIDDGSSIGRTFELGGPDVYTLNELVALVYEAIGEEPQTLYLPFSVAKLISTPEDIFKSIPLPTQKLVTFSRNNIASLHSDYVVSPDALTFYDLGVIPKKLKGIAIEHLHRYRTGSPVVSSVGKQSSQADSKV